MSETISGGVFAGNAAHSGSLVNTAATMSDTVSSSVPNARVPVNISNRNCAVVWASLCLRGRDLTKSWGTARSSRAL